MSGPAGSWGDITPGSSGPAGPVEPWGSASFGRCVVQFRPGLARRFRSTDKAYQLPSLVADADVLRCVCQKDMEGLAGTFEIDLTYNRTSIAAQVGKKPGLTLSWNLLLLPDNIVWIYFARGSKVPLDAPTIYDPYFLPGTDDLYPWMVGLIDSVSESTTMAKNSVQHTIRVRGRDYGKILQVHQLHWQAETLGILDATELTRRIAASYYAGGPPRDMIEKVMDILVDKTEFPDARDLIIYKPNQTHQVGAAQDLLPTQPTDVDPMFKHAVLDERLANPQEYGAYQPVALWDRGTFANFLERYNDRGFTEMWTDTRPDGYFSLYLREMPFDRKNWEKLPGKAVPDSEILSHQLMRSDAHRVNQVMVYGVDWGASNQDMGQWDFFNLRWDRYSFENGSQHHGTRKLIVATHYDVPTVQPTKIVAVRDLTSDHPLYDDDQNIKMQSGQGPVMDLMRLKGAKLWRWHSLAHRMHVGRVIITGDPFWRVGYRFENQRGESASYAAEEDRRRWGYVQTVAQEFVYGSHYRTHLGVTRMVHYPHVLGEGLPTDGLEFKAPWSAARQKQANDLMDELNL